MLAKKITQAVRGFHEDEEGIEALQVVMIVAIAAFILVLFRKQIGTVIQWVEGLLSKMTSSYNA